MAQQHTQHIAHKLDNLTETESAHVLKYISKIEAARPARTNATDDELIAALQNRPENARARQVFEWETARREFSPENFLRDVA